MRASTYYQYIAFPSYQQEDWTHNCSTAFYRAVCTFLFALRSRNRLIVYDFPTFSLDKYLESALSYKCKALYSTKQAIDALAACSGLNGPSNVTTIFSAGAVVPHATRQAVNNLFGKNVLQVSYAITEAGGAISTESPLYPAGQSTSVGKLLPHIRAKILDADDGYETIEPDTPGNLQWCSIATLKGY